MDGKFIAYYRVSTDHQGVNGNGIAKASVTHKVTRRPDATAG
jgi:hypothetical protein